MKDLYPPTDENKELYKYLNNIDIVMSGGHALHKNAHQFLPPRLGELPEVYASRLRHSSNPPVVADYLKTLVNRMANGLFKLQPTSGTFWADYRQMYEMRLLRTIVLHIAKYGRVVTRYSEDGYAQIIHPTQLRRWSDGLFWVMYQEDTVLRSAAADPEDVRKYTVYENGQVYEQTYAGKQTEPSTSELGQYQYTPFTVYSADPTYWLCDVAYAEAVKLFVLSSHLYNLADSAYFQRTFKETVQNEDAAQAAMAAAFSRQEEGIQPGLEYVLKLDEFKWNEPTGAILDKIQNIISETKTSLEQVFDLNTSTSANASGRSRAYAFIEQRQTVLSFAQAVLEALKQIYENVADIVGIAAPVLILPEDAFDVLEDDTKL